MPLVDDSLPHTFASCILVIDDVNLSVTPSTTESRGFSSVREMLRNLVEQQQFVMPITSTEQSRLRKSNGHSFLQRDSNHIRILATSNRFSLESQSRSGLAVVNFAKLLWNDASAEIIQHIFKTTISFQTLHIQNAVSKSLLDSLTSATMDVFLGMNRQSIMSEQCAALSHQELAKIRFVTIGEDVVKDSKRGRAGSTRKWLKVEKSSTNEGSRSQLLLSVSSAEADSTVNQFVIISVHLGVPQKWDKESSSLNFYFNLDKADPFVCESERASDWVSGVSSLLANLKSLRERVQECWKCDYAEKLPLGVTFDLRRLGTVMTFFSAECSSARTASPNDLWTWWRAALLHAFSLDVLALNHLQKSMDDATRAHFPSSAEILNAPKSPVTATSVASQSVHKWSLDSESSMKAVLMQFPTVSFEHMQLVNQCPSIIQFTANLDTLLKCRRLVVECSSVDATSSAVVACACERLGHAAFHFSSFERSEQSAVDGRSAPFNVSSFSHDQDTTLRSLNACLRMCVKCVCLDRKPSVILMTVNEMLSLKHALRLLYQLLDDGDCSELFSVAEMYALALDAEEAPDNGQKNPFDVALLRKLRGPKNYRAVEELQEYDHVVPLFGLGREVLSSVSFFMGSTAARGRISLSKNATGGSARLDAVMRARLTHDIKVLVLAGPESGTVIGSNTDTLKILLRGDFVKAKLPSLSSAQMFKDMLSDASRSNANSNKLFAESLCWLAGPDSNEVLEALQDCYERAMSYFTSVDSCAPYQYLIQFKMLYENKLLGIHHTINEHKILEEVEENQSHLVALYRHHEMALRQQQDVAKLDMDKVLQEIVTQSGLLSRQQRNLMKSMMSGHDLKEKGQNIDSESLDTFSNYCHLVAGAFQLCDLQSLRDLHLEEAEQLVLDALALLLNADVSICSFLVTSDGQLLPAPSHPTSLNALITLQDQGSLGSGIDRLGQSVINEESLELVLAILELLPVTQTGRQGTVLHLLTDFVLRFVREGTSRKSQHVPKESQEAAAADARAAEADAQKIEIDVVTLENRIRVLHEELDAKTALLQRIQSEFSVVESSITRLVSVFMELQSWRTGYFMQDDSSFRTSEQAAIDKQTRLLARHCASLAAFITFGGLDDGDSRLRLLRSLEGMELFACCKTSKAFRNQSVCDSSGFDFSDAVADESTQLLWQQCGLPEHPELFTSVSLVLASAKIPFVFDKTGVFLEFLHNMSLCNHLMVHDIDAPLPPPQTDSSGQYCGALVRSTSDFPVFVRTCPTAAPWTNLGRLRATGLTIVTLPDSRDAIEKVIKSCAEGQLLVFHIPAQQTHAHAAMRSLSAFVPLFLLPKIRTEVQTVHVSGRVLLVNVQFTCVIINESDLRPSWHLTPLLSEIRFTQGLDPMRHVLLRAFVLQNSVSLMTSLCVMRQRLLYSAVESDALTMKLLVNLSDLSAFVRSSRNESDVTSSILYSAQGTAFITTNLNKVENCLEDFIRTKASLSRVQPLLSQLNASLMELIPYTVQYHPSLALAAGSSAANMGVSNMYKVFFKLLNSKFDETATAQSSPNSRNKSVKSSASTGVSGATLIFRQLCALIPQKHRLSVALFALRDWLGGDDGLRLLVNAPLPPSSPAWKFIKTSQSVPVSISANNVTGAIASSKSQGMNPIKKPVKGSTQNNVVANAGSVVPDVAPSHTSGPLWMPVDKYARLAKVIYKTFNLLSTFVR